jgi:hypothetical protein
MVDTPDARKVVLIISTDRGLTESVDKIVARAKCRAVAVRDCTAAERAIERVRPVLILLDPLRPDEPSARLRGMCIVVEIPVRTSSSGIRRLAKPGTEAVRWLTDLVADRCATGP